MKASRFAIPAVCFAVALATGGAPSAPAQSCNASQDAAVQCFVNNAVRTNLTSLRYGMTMSQFRSYGIAVSKVMETQQAYIVLFGLSSAIADAMPPTNANGTANLAAQQAAVNAIVQAEITDSLLTLPKEVSAQQAKWLSLDMVSSMNDTSGIMLSPGTLLRITDSNVVAATSNGVVNWTQADTNLGTMVSGLSTAGLLKLPPSVSVSSAQAFALDLARAIYTYKSSTGRSSL